MVQSPGVKASASALEFVSREDTKRDAFPRPCLWPQDIYQNLPRSESHSPLASNLDKPAVHSAFEGGLRVGAVIHGHGRLPKMSRLGRYCYLTSLPIPRPVPAAADRPYQLGCQCGPLPDVDSFNKFVRLLCHLHLRPISVPVPNPCSGHRPLSPRTSALAGGYPWPALRGAPCSALGSSGSCRGNHGFGSKSSAGRSLWGWVFTVTSSPEAHPKEGRLSLWGPGPGSTSRCFGGKLCPYPGYRLGML